MGNTYASGGGGYASTSGTLGGQGGYFSGINTITTGGSTWTNNDPIYWKTGQLVPITQEIYRDNITRNIYDQAPLVPRTKEKTVKQEVQTVVAKRREKKIERLVARYAEFFGDDDDFESGRVFAWDTTFNSNRDVTYHYVAVRGGRSWYLTNRTGALSSDDLLSMLVEHSMEGTVNDPRWLS